MLCVHACFTILKEYSLKTIGFFLTWNSCKKRAFQVKLCFLLYFLWIYYMVNKQYASQFTSETIMLITIFLIQTTCEMLCTSHQNTFEYTLFVYIEHIFLHTTLNLDSMDSPFTNITHLFHLSWSSSKCIQERAKSIHMMFEQILLSRVTISDPWLTTKFRGAWVVLWHQPTTKQVRWVGWPHMEDVSLHKDESVLTTIAVLAPHFSTNMLWHSSLLTSQCCVSSISKLL